MLGSLAGRDEGQIDSHVAPTDRLVSAERVVTSPPKPVPRFVLAAADLN